MKRFAIQILVTLVLFNGLVYCESPGPTPADELEFKVYRGMTGVVLSCSINDVQPSNFAHLNNLMISKRSSGTNKVVASVSSLHGQEEPISHVPAAEINGSLFSGEKPQGFLRILWTDPDPGLNGDYVCDLHGMDPDLLSKTVSKILPLNIESLCPCFTAEPAVIKLGITKQLEISCFYPNFSPQTFSELTSLIIFTTRDGIKEKVAEINSISGIISQPVDLLTYVNGSLHRNLTFISVKWDYPTAELAVEYICEGSGVSTNDSSIFFKRQLSVTTVEPTREELVERLLEMYKIERELLKNKTSDDNASNAGQSMIPSSTTPETGTATSAAAATTRTTEATTTNAATTISTTAETTTKTKSPITEQPQYRPPQYRPPQYRPPQRRWPPVPQQHWHPHSHRRCSPHSHRRWHNHHQRRRFL